MEDYEPCGTCGYDHVYDSAYPGVKADIKRAHILAKDLSPHDPSEEDDD